ncbi:MAG: porin [Xanthomonadales bacterium]|nr:porin [Xanthomonadales bacterium]
MVNALSRSVAQGLAVSALLSTSTAWSQESVAERIEKLEREMAALKRELEADQQAVAEREAKAARVEYGKSGLRVSSADGQDGLRLRGYLQTDSRTFISDDENLGVDTFLVRRARPILEGHVGDFNFRLMYDLAQSDSSRALFDAYAEYRPGKAFALRAGKFKVPFGLDRLRSANDIAFVERSMPNNLAPNRDVGLMAYGTFLPGFSWELGLFNGVQDLGNVSSNADDELEWAARLFAHPFAGSGSALEGLGLGVAATWGEKDGSPASRQVGDYRSPSQVRVFRYRSGTHADGDHWRIGPQGYFYAGPFGMQAEYAVSSQQVRNGDQRAEIENSAWEVQFRYVMTGEDAAHKGWPAATNAFNPRDGHWGAWEIAAKVGQLDIDAAAFPWFADPAAAVARADNYGLALHGYLTDNVKVIVDYEHTRFDGGASAGADRETEQVVLARINYKF